MWQSVLNAVNLIAEPLTYEFMQRALISAVIVGLLCSVMGSYLVVRRLSLLGLVVSNSVVPGIAVSFLLYINIFVGGFISGILSTVTLGWLQTKVRIKEDAAMGVILSSFFAVGILLITRIQNERKVNLNDFLFGNILAITLPDLFTSATIAFLVLVTVWILYKEFLLLSFDPQWTEAVGLPARNLHYTMMALTALTVVASMQSVGVALTIALLIIPAATAYLVTNRFTTMMQLAIALGITSSLLGLYLSYYQNTASGPSITIVSGSFFTLTALGRFLWQKFAPLRTQAPNKQSKESTNTSEAMTIAPAPVVTSEPKARRITRDANGKLIIQSSETNS